MPMKNDMEYNIGQEYEPVEGYIFTGWYAEPDCNGKQVKMLMGIDFYEKKGDEFDWSTTKPITLCAGWARN